MQTLLLWQLEANPAAHDDEVERVHRRLADWTKNLFGLDAQAFTRNLGGFGLVYLELPVLGWKSPRCETSGTEFAITLDYPADLERGIARAPEAAGGDSTPALLRLGRALLARHGDVLAELSPTFALIHGDRDKDEFHVHNDGLGYCQLLEYSKGARFALTNRPLALRALDIELQPEPTEWAARALSGWFPLDRTGFRELRAVAPGTHYSLSRRGVERRCVDVVRRWLTPLGLDRDAAIEHAGIAVRDHLLAASRHWERAGIAFSAGRDSRAIVATMLRAGIPIDYLRTHGQPRNTEMIIARHLGKLLGVEHQLQFGRGLPPQDEKTLVRSFEMAVSWQCGLMENKAHKGFFRNRKHLGTGKVNIMGKHGELGRGYYYGRAERTRSGLSDPQGALLEYFTTTDIDLLAPSLRDGARELLRASIARADDYGLERHQVLDFFYLFERTRRWGAGTIYNQRDKVITPFLTPGYIQASFHLDQETRRSNGVQAAIVDRYGKVFAGVPYLSDDGARKWGRLQHGRFRRAWESMIEFLAIPFRPEERAYVLSRGRRYAFDNTTYWQTVGAPVIQRAREGCDLVGQVFDRDALRRRLPKEPDVLAVALMVENVVRSPFA